MGCTLGDTKKIDDGGQRVFSRLTAPEGIAQRRMPARLLPDAIVAQSLGLTMSGGVVGAREPGIFADGCAQRSTCRFQFSAMTVRRQRYESLGGFGAERWSSSLDMLNESPSHPVGVPKFWWRSS